MTDVGAQPRCPKCSVLMRDIDGGYRCPACGHTIYVTMQQQDLPADFTGPTIHGG